MSQGNYSGLSSKMSKLIWRSRWTSENGIGVDYNAADSYLLRHWMDRIEVLCSIGSGTSGIVW